MHENWFLGIEIPLLFCGFLPHAFVFKLPCKTATQLTYVMDLQICMHPSSISSTFRYWPLSILCGHTRWARQDIKERKTIHHHQSKWSLALTSRYAQFGVSWYHMLACDRHDSSTVRDPLPSTPLNHGPMDSDPTMNSYELVPGFGLHWFDVDHPIDSGRFDVFRSRQSNDSLVCPLQESEALTSTRGRGRSKERIGDNFHLPGIKGPSRTFAFLELQENFLAKETLETKIFLVEWSEEGKGWEWNSVLEVK